MWIMTTDIMSNGLCSNFQMEKSWKSATTDFHKQSRDIASCHCYSSTHFKTILLKMPSSFQIFVNIVIQKLLSIYDMQRCLLSTLKWSLGFYEGIVMKLETTLPIIQCSHTMVHAKINHVFYNSRLGCDVGNFEKHS